MKDNNFLGRNDFIWFSGVVEDRKDPQKTGRVRVRYLGRKLLCHLHRQA